MVLDLFLEIQKLKNLTNMSEYFRKQMIISELAEIMIKSVNALMRYSEYPLL